jgi:hypothetical protein
LKTDKETKIAEVNAEGGWGEIDLDLEIDENVAEPNQANLQNTQSI